jgi:feruloyl-CoA synthase
MSQCAAWSHPLSAVATYRDARLGGCLAAQLESRADGSRVLRSTEPLQAYP